MGKMIVYEVYVVIQFVNKAEHEGENFNTIVSIESLLVVNDKMEE